MKKHPKILVISASGIGCSIMFTPTLRAIREKFPNCHITFLGISKSFIIPVRNSSYVDEVMVFDFPKTSLMHIDNLLERLRNIREIRKKRFDYSITVFPSNKWLFNVFAWLSGAQKRITHSYQTPSWQNMQFLQNKKIPAIEGLHDVEQNINLLTSLGGVPDKLDKTLSFHISSETNKQADNYCRANFDGQKRIIGMHIGSSIDYAFESKRWPLDNFTQLIDRIQLELDAQVAIFTGPNEENDISQAQLNMKTTPKVINLTLEMVAAIIKKCNLMICNDSGLMHMAVAVGTPVVAIFGPTNISRTRPYTPDATVIFDPQCHSLMKYPFSTTRANISPQESLRCFETISVDKVFTAVQKRLYRTGMQE